MSKTPVIIAARNEQDFIGRTLGSLDGYNYDPIVSVNGSSDRTAEIARSFGALVLEHEKPGKLPAIQRAIRDGLGPEKCLDPFLLLDADSYPLHPNEWDKTMIGNLDDDRPSISSGIIAYVDSNPVSDLIRSIRRNREAKKAKAINANLARGFNMAIRIHNSATLRRILDMPHYWLGDDMALNDYIVKSGGSATQELAPHSRVASSSRFLPTMRERILLGQEATGSIVRKNYSERAPADSIEYEPSKDDYINKLT